MLNGTFRNDWINIIQSNIIPSFPVGRNNFITIILRHIVLKIIKKMSI